MSALDRVRTAIAAESDPERREVLALEDRPVALVMRPSSWAEDRLVQDKIGTKNRPEEQIALAAIHLAKFVLSVQGVSEDGKTTEPLYGDGSEALLDQRLADELGVTFVSSGTVLRDLLGDANTEQAFLHHSQWSTRASGERVRRLGESQAGSSSGD